MNSSQILRFLYIINLWNCLYSWNKQILCCSKNNYVLRLRWPVTGKGACGGTMSITWKQPAGHMTSCLCLVPPGACFIASRSKQLYLSREQVPVFCCCAFAFAIAVAFKAPWAVTYWQWPLGSECAFSQNRPSEMASAISFPLIFKSKSAMLHLAAMYTQLCFLAVPFMQHSSTT